MALGRNQAQVTVERDGSSFLVSWRVFNGGDFTYVKNSFRQQFPRSSGAEWCPDAKCWAVPAWQRDTLASWLAYVFTRDAVTWGGHEERGEYQRHQDAPRQASQVDRLDEAYRALHLLPTAPPEVVQAAQRALVKIHHPDAGGTHEAAVAINRAVEIIHQHVTRSGAA